MNRSLREVAVHPDGRSPGERSKVGRGQPARSSACLDERSLALRARVLETLACAGRGHIGASFSIVEILRVLYDDVLRLDASRPEWPDRDRFVLSKGHGVATLHVLLAEKGYFPAAELQRFCALGALLGGHPERRVPGVEATTGSLGHGLPLALGMALAARMQRLDYRTYVVVGDGECNEGSVWEALLHAAKHQLDNLVVIVDYNKLQSWGRTALVCELEPLADKLSAFGCNVLEVDGHDVNALRNAFQVAARLSGAPTAVVCHTVKGRGLRLAEHNPAWHHVNQLDQAQVRAWIAELSAQPPAPLEPITVELDRA